MKIVATTIVALFASVALANSPAATPAPTAATPAATATTPAPAAPTAKAPAKAAKTAAAAVHAADCTKLTGEAKTKCEAAATPAPTHK